MAAGVFLLAFLSFWVTLESKADILSGFKVSLRWAKTSSCRLACCLLEKRVQSGVLKLPPMVHQSRPGGAEHRVTKLTVGPLAATEWIRELANADGLLTLAKSVLAKTRRVCCCSRAGLWFNHERDPASKEDGETDHNRPKALQPRLAARMAVKYSGEETSSRRKSKTVVG